MKILMVIISLLIAATVCPGGTNSAFAVDDSNCKAAKAKMLTFAKGMQEGDKRVIPADVKADADMLFTKCMYRSGEFEFETGVSRDAETLVKKKLSRHANLVVYGQVMVGQLADGTPHQTAIDRDGKKYEDGGQLAKIDATYTVKIGVIIDEDGDAEKLFTLEPVRNKIAGYLSEMSRQYIAKAPKGNRSGIAAFTQGYIDEVAQHEKPVINRVPVLNDQLYKNYR